MQINVTKFVQYIPPRDINSLLRSFTAVAISNNYQYNRYRRHYFNYKALTHRVITTILYFRTIFPYYVSCYNFILHYRAIAEIYYLA